MARPYSVFRSLDVTSTEADVKASPGRLMGWYISNANAAAAVFVKFYNAAAADVTVGTTTPYLTVRIPAASATNVNWGGGSASGDSGIPFEALSVAAVTGVADNNTTAPSTNDIVANIFYQ